LSVYVAGNALSAVAIFDRDPASGALAQNPGTAGCISDSGTGGACQDGNGLLFPVNVAVSNDGKSVYATSQISDSVAIFDREAGTPGPTGKCVGKTATKVGTAAADVLSGTGKADVIAGLGGNDTLKGLGGADGLCGGAGKDTEIGGGGKDTLLGQGGPDTLKGGKANDTLKGGPAKDRLIGGGGKDKMVGGAGRNTYKGGGGADAVKARNKKKDTINCGPGRDTALVDKIDTVRKCERVRRR
jgi:Ca2+-binding RTX toxin-like protein